MRCKVIRITVRKSRKRVMICNCNRTEQSIIQGVIGRVISNYEHDYP